MTAWPGSPESRAEWEKTYKQWGDELDAANAETLVYDLPDDAPAPFLVTVEGDDMIPRMTFSDRDALCITLYALASQWRHQSADYYPRRSRATDTRAASVTWEVMFELAKAAHDQQGMDVAAITGIGSLHF